MPLLRNPFRSKPSDIVAEDNDRPDSSGAGSFPEKTSTWGAVTKPTSIRSSSSTSELQPREYKLSEINDSGEYLPPSPTETKSSFWSTRSGASTRSSSHRSVVNDTEPFNISRESFDSYRRSFDICARSPVLEAASQRPRQSLDARRMRLPSSLSSSPIPASKRTIPASQQQIRPLVTPYQPKLNSLPDDHVNPPSAQPEESDDVLSQQNSKETSPSSNDSVSTNPTTPSESLGDRFEDVGLGEPNDPLAKKAQPPQQAKKPSIFSRFAGSSSTTSDGIANPAERPTSSGHIGLGLGVFGRKRGQSGQGAELGSIASPPNVNAKKGVATASGAQEVRTEN